MERLRVNREIVRSLMDDLVSVFVGRIEEAQALVLALVTREHAVLIGPPGTAKSALVGRLAELLEARFFKYMLTRFTEPAELFGPLDIAALRRGEYRRITRGKLPEAEIVFLDEIFKANSAILNALLSIMQERVWYDGSGEVRVPLWSLIGASNEEPMEEELEALYDRFAIKKRVDYLNSMPLYMEALELIYRGARPQPRRSPSEYRRALEELGRLAEELTRATIVVPGVGRVRFTELAYELIVKPAVSMRSRGVRISDRTILSRLPRLLAAAMCLFGVNIAVAVSWSTRLLLWSLPVSDQEKVEEHERREVASIADAMYLIERAERLASIGMVDEAREALGLASEMIAELSRRVRGGLAAAALRVASERLRELARRLREEAKHSPAPASSG